jgi:hypothetical protein
MNIKRNSSIFFSGALTLIEDKLYLELQNFSFIRINTSSEKQMPWSLKSTQASTSTSNNTARSIHNLNKKLLTNKIQVSDPPTRTSTSPTRTPLTRSPPTRTPPTRTPPTHSPPTRTTPTRTLPTPESVEKRTYFKLGNVTSISDSDLEEVEPKNSSTPTRRKTRSTSKTNNKINTTPIENSDLEEVEPTSTPIKNLSTPSKRKTRSSSYKTNRKTRKLADIASSIISIADSDREEIEENENV